jgi:hypothetical protein
MGEHALAAPCHPDYAEARMHDSTSLNQADEGGDLARRRAWLEIALIFLLLFIEGAWPVPDSNEPHYLAKARHYWDADWCADDFFLIRSFIGLLVGSPASSRWTLWPGWDDSSRGGCSPGPGAD